MFQQPVDFRKTRKIKWQKKKEKDKQRKKYIFNTPNQKRVVKGRTDRNSTIHQHEYAKPRYDKYITPALFHLLAKRGPTQSEAISIDIDHCQQHTDPNDMCLTDKDAKPTAYPSQGILFIE